MLYKVTSDNFDEQVIESDSPVVLMLWQPACAPCTSAKNAMKLMAHDNPDVKFCMCNSKQEREVKKKLGTKGTPTVLFYKNGEEKTRIDGLVKMTEYEEALTALKEDE